MSVTNCCATNYHKFSSLKQQIFFISQFLQVRYLAWLSWAPLAKGLLGGCKQIVSQSWSFIKRLSWGKSASKLSSIAVWIQFLQGSYTEGLRGFLNVAWRPPSCHKGASIEQQTRWQKWHSITSAASCSLVASHKVQLSLKVRR